MKIWDNRNTFSLINKSGRFSTVTTFVSTLRLTDTLTSRVRMRERERERKSDQESEQVVLSREGIYIPSLFRYNFPRYSPEFLEYTLSVVVLVICGLTRTLRRRKLLVTSVSQWEAREKRLKSNGNNEAKWNI